MVAQEDVETPVEQPTETESSAVESSAEDDKATETSSTPVEESSQPKKVSDSVPYERFKEVNDRLNDPSYIAQKASEMGIIQQTQKESTGEIPELDPDAAKAVDRMVSEKIELAKVQEFLSKHGDELKESPLLDARVKALIAENRSRGKYIPQEDALAQARKELEEFSKPKTEEAVNQAIENEKNLSKEKQTYSAVGDNKANPKVDPDKLSAEDFRKFHGLTYVE